MAERVSFAAWKAQRRASFSAGLRRGNARQTRPSMGVTGHSGWKTQSRDWRGRWKYEGGRIARAIRRADRRTLRRANTMDANLGLYREARALSEGLRQLRG